MHAAAHVRTGFDIAPASDHSILVTLGAEISPEIHTRVRKFCELLARNLHDAVMNVHPAYASVLVTFEPRMADLEEIGAYLDALLERIEEVELPPARLIEVPVCYGGEFGPDLEEIARRSNITPEELIRLHSSSEYTVYFLGFAPGFAYLVGVDPRIVAPRLEKPRPEIPAGSVGIAGAQTGIYPLPTPGSLRLIGRTPLRIFDPKRTKPSLLTFGDRVRFFPVSPEEFEIQCRQSE
jgi:KipI family sensor histidine kinase inhibitor